MKSWKQGYDVKALLDRRLALSSSLESSLYDPVFVSAFDYDEGVPEDERLRIVQEALAGIQTEVSPTPEKLLSRIAQHQLTFLARPEHKYYVFASMSLRAHRSFRSRSDNSVRLDFLASMPRSTRLQQLETEFEKLSVAKRPNWHSVVRASLSARSQSSALEQAFNTISFFRGLWNFLLDRERFRLTFGGTTTRPFGEVLTGPRFFLLSREKEGADDQLGVIPGYTESRIAPSRPELAEPLARSEQKVRRQLSRIPYRGELRTAFIRYARIMDEANMDACLLGLWGLIEQLTDTLQRPSKETIRRTVSLFGPVEPTKSMLEHLREHRNGIAHLGRPSDFGELLVGQAKFFVERLIGFHLDYGRLFSAVEEAGRFLEISKDEATLRREIDLRSLALRLR